MYSHLGRLKRVGIHCLGVFVDPLNGRAGEDVVKLVEQDGLPGRVQAITGNDKPVLGSSNAPHFGFPQREFALAVGPLGARLGGQGAAVTLEVEFADVTGVRPAGCLLASEKVCR